MFNYNSFAKKTIEKIDCNKEEDHLVIYFTDGSILGLSLINEKIFQQLRLLTKIKDMI